MSESIIEQIAATIAARIESVTLANGYWQDVSRVVRPTRSFEYTIEDNLVLIEQQAWETLDELSHEGNPVGQARRQFFQISLFVVPPRTSATPVDTLINRLAADVEKAIALGGADPRWVHMDDLAIDARFTSGTRFIHADGSSEGIDLILAVDYRTDEDDPYVVR